MLNQGSHLFVGAQKGKVRREVFILKRLTKPSTETLSPLLWTSVSCATRDKSLSPPQTESIGRTRGIELPLSR